MTGDKELLVALWTIANAPPLPKLPNLCCFYCGKEIEGRWIAFERAYACHPGRCIKLARKGFGRSKEKPE